MEVKPECPFWSPVQSLCWVASSLPLTLKLGLAQGPTHVNAQVPGGTNRDISMWVSALSWAPDGSVPSLMTK